jgi:hypothetical protein
MGGNKINPYVVKAVVYMTVAVACFALLILKLFIWEERSIIDIVAHERLVDILVVLIVVIVAYLLYERLVKSLD